MTRKWLDCRDYPDTTGCTLYLSGEADHVVQAAAEHAASVHGEADTQELRDNLRGMLKEEVAIPRSSTSAPKRNWRKLPIVFAVCDENRHVS